jgi:hypothetical protein
MKPGLLLVVLLLFAASAQAQHCHTPSGASSGGPVWNFGGTLGSSTINWEQSGLQYEPPRTYTVGYAKNDGEYIPTTYMNYEDALALGKQQLAARQLSVSVQSTANVPLGDVARFYRNLKVTNLQASAIRVDSDKLRALSEGLSKLKLSAN